ncbi:hypothetical protein [Dactylosporangium sp. NPDC051541]|uniref:hypothetical protein n=1 Tax=Dactylosporangium sp. NPDC051541 TaxID=3363977 RepID=UPI0037939D06
MEMFAGPVRTIRADTRRAAGELRALRESSRRAELARVGAVLRARQARWARVRAAAAGGVLARPDVWAGLRRLSWRAAQPDRLFDRLLVVCGVPMAAAMFGGPAVVLTRAGVHPMEQVALIAVGTAAGFLPYPLMWRRLGGWYLLVMLTLTGALAAVVPFPLFPVMFVQWAVFTVVFLLIMAAYALLHRGPAAEVAAAEWLGWLLNALNTRDLRRAADRRAVARGLERLAVIFESGFARALRTSDAEAGAEIRGRLRRIAAGIRAQQVAIALPDAGTVAGSAGSCWPAPVPSPPGGSAASPGSSTPSRGRCGGGSWPGWRSCGRSPSRWCRGPRSSSCTFRGCCPGTSSGAGPPPRPPCGPSRCCSWPWTRSSGCRSRRCGSSSPRSGARAERRQLPALS